MPQLNELKTILLNFSDREITSLMELLNEIKSAKKAKTNQSSGKWFDKSFCGLDAEGMKQLKGLKALSDDAVTAFRVNTKQLSYLESLKDMKLIVPSFFHECVNPRELYKRLKSFCQENDIPDEIINRIIPSLVTYIETGHMRPIIFVGEKGCGKTTAVRLLFNTALQLPTEVIKAPQTDGGRGLTGDNASYHAADAGLLANGRLRNNSLLVVYLIDEVDKITHGRNKANLDDELLSLTDDSNADIVDNFLQAKLVGLEYCPILFTANDLSNVNPILADRCTIIRFPNPDAKRIKSILRKYVGKKLESSLYGTIRFDYGMMDNAVDHLVKNNVTSLRQHQQIIEVVLESALNTALLREDGKETAVTTNMFAEAENAVLCSSERRMGFNS